MKEIKFRLIKDDKIVGYERHVLNKQCGDERPNVVCIEHSRIGTEYDRDIAGSGWWCIWRDRNCFIDHDHKDQFTTKTDKNGKEIYGGDRVRGMIDDEPCRWTVEWETDDMLGWSIDNTNEPLEVIGSIHEKKD